MNGRVWKSYLLGVLTGMVAIIFVVQPLAKLAGTFTFHLLH